MYSKTSYTLCSSSSYRTRDKLLNSIFGSNITERLYSAQLKLRPVIDDVMLAATENSTNRYGVRSHGLTVQQYEDAISAFELLKEVDRILSEKQNGVGIKKTYNINNFKLDRESIKVNRFGKIYVDTSILIQLIELHKTFGDIINNAQETTTDDTTSNDTNLCEKTVNLPSKFEGRETSPEKKFNVLVTQGNSENSKPKIKINVVNSKFTDTDQLTNEVKCERKSQQKALPNSLFKSITIMPAQSEKSDGSRDRKKLPTLSEEDRFNFTSGTSSRKIKSTGSITSEDELSKVTDVAGARKIILKCLYDLKKVRSFLETIDVDVSAEVHVKGTTPADSTSDGSNKLNEPMTKEHVYRGEVTDSSQPNEEGIFSEVVDEDDKTEESTTQAHTPPRNKNSVPRPDESKPHRKCSCGPIQVTESPMELMFDGGDENASRLVICIKGKTEDEGDVQIIIRQCSECKNVGGNDLTESDSIDKQSHSNPGAHHEQTKDKEEHLERRSGIKLIFDPDDPSRSVVEPIKEEPAKHTASSERHQMFDHHPFEPDAPPDKHAEEKHPINVIFDPTDPSKSVVESPKNITDPNHQKKEDCSRIKLYQTTNLCFATDDGQELVISLTIRPKVDGAVPQISLNDLFRESTPEIDKPGHTQKEVHNIFGSEADFTVGVQDKSHLDHFIPLSRTKVCSSLQFDVSVMETKIKNRGIKHANPGIVVRLKELGVNNLLRACRPAKCGRAAVLNEKLRKGLPYSASLTSLPLEDNDVDIIDQSLQMSMSKTKFFSVQNKKKTMAYFSQLENMNNVKFTKNAHISFLHIDGSRVKVVKRANDQEYNTSYVRKKLNYYINLLHDIKVDRHASAYEINFFEIKKYDSSQHIQKSGAKPLLEDKGIVKDKEMNSSALDVDIEKEQTLKSINMPNKIPPHLERLKCKPEREIQKISNIKNVPSPLPQHKKESNIEEQGFKKKRFISKIPVYKYNKKTNFISDDKLLVDHDSYIYDISIHSLPKDDANNIQTTANNQKKSTCKKLKCINQNDATENNKERKMECNSNKNVNWQSVEKLIYSNSKINYSSTKVSTDSLELYFNNFFRDKYFSKLALCQKQSSSRSLLMRKKKSEYQCSGSHSQTCLSDSKLNLRRFSTNFANQKPDNGPISITENVYSDTSFVSMEEMNISSNLINYFNQMLCDYWITDGFVREKRNKEEKVKEVKSIASSIDIFKSEVLQKVFLNVKHKILEEDTHNLCNLLSQPNVEAGMEHDDSSARFNNGSRSWGENTKISHEETLKVLKGTNEFEYAPKANEDIFTKFECSSCDNFQNMIVTFGSNTSIEAMSAPNQHFELSKNSLSDHRFGVVSEITGRNMLERLIEANVWENADVEPLCYLVYQHYINAPTFLQRIIEKSKVLFKSNCRSNKQGANKEGLNNPSLHSLKECNTCGCSIEKCESTSRDKPCACPKGIKEVTTPVSESHGEPTENGVIQIPSQKMIQLLKKCRRKEASACQSKKSVGMLCFPKKADKCVCVKIESNMQPAKTCACIKCKKRSMDGSCYCSHCLGIFDKSVGIKPSNKDIATQCISRPLDKINGEQEVPNTSRSNENQMVNQKDTNMQFAISNSLEAKEIPSNENLEDELEPEKIVEELIFEDIDRNDVENRIEESNPEEDEYPIIGNSNTEEKEMDYNENESNIKDDSNKVDKEDKKQQ